MPLTSNTTKKWISLPNEVAEGLSISATGPNGFAWGDPGLDAEFYSPAFYTNYGTNAIDLGAPGGDVAPEVLAEIIDDDDEPLPPGWYFDLILSTIAVFDRNEAGELIGDVPYNWNWVGGTSMAAPNVSGAAALVKANNPEYNPEQIESALKRAADVLEDYEKTYYGAGYLNMLDAL